MSFISNAIKFNPIKFIAQYLSPLTDSKAPHTKLTEAKMGMEKTEVLPKQIANSTDSNEVRNKLNEKKITLYKSQKPTGNIKKIIMFFSLFALFTLLSRSVSLPGALARIPLPNNLPTDQNSLSMPEAELQTYASLVSLQDETTCPRTDSTTITIIPPQDEEICPANKVIITPSTGASNTTEPANITQDPKDSTTQKGFLSKTADNNTNLGASTLYAAGAGLLTGAFALSGGTETATKIIECSDGRRYEITLPASFADIKDSAWGVVEFALKTTILNQLPPAKPGMSFEVTLSECEWKAKGKQDSLNSENKETKPLDYKAIIHKDDNLYKSLRNVLSCKTQKEAEDNLERLTYTATSHPLCPPVISSIHLPVPKFDHNELKGIAKLEPLGIVNEGNDCFLSALIQFLLGDLSLEELLINNREKYPLKEIGEFLFNYRDAQKKAGVAQQKASSCKGIHQLRKWANKLTDAKDSPFTNGQHDAKEVFQLLMKNECLDKLLKQNNLCTNHEIKRKWRLNNHTLISNELNKRLNEEGITVDSDGYGSITKNPDYFGIHMLEHKNHSLSYLFLESFNFSNSKSTREVATKDGSQKAQFTELSATPHWSSPPSQLVLSLNTFKMGQDPKDPQAGAEKTDPLPLVDKELKLKKEWISDGKGSDCTYLLTNFMVHENGENQTESGHWITYKCVNGKYYQCSDNEVIVLNEDQFLTAAKSGSLFRYSKSQP